MSSMLAPHSLARSVRDHLVTRGLLEQGVALGVEVMEGGVSCDVVGVTAGGRSFVLKRALPRLRVERDWFADPSRMITEGRALRVVAQLTPAAVPPVVDLDEQHAVLVMVRAPASWANWREELLAGRVDSATGRRLGELLAAWHSHTARTAHELSDLHNTEVFQQLRIDPFHRTIARRHPDLAGRVERVVEQLLTTKACLVHGDFSPKNVLRGPGEAVWVLDWEVAHVGNPQFDLAYMLTHLALKALHRPADASRYQAVAREFLTAYQTASGASHVFGARKLAAHVGCLLLARVDGKSPATYLREHERARARILGRWLLQESPADVLELWTKGV